MNLRENQRTAIQISIDNDFQSGIHYHATGTGKSWIAMKVVEAYHKRYPKSNILWICERKDILQQQFSRETIKSRGFSSIMNGYNVLDFTQNKSSKWYDSLNAAGFWGMPFLCIINRCFLTSKRKYRKIQKKIGLVIHDECHSIENKTTQEFYNWLLETNNVMARVIGFSATPEQIAPLDNILSKYSIYDGFKDEVILPPKIVWIKSEEEPSDNELIELIKRNLRSMPYKKIIVWCGMVEECIEKAALWSEKFPDYMICLDFHSIDNSIQDPRKKSYREFYKAEEKAILFCAVKHREGSDIPNLDCCIFMDKVEKRSERVFIQAMGRVLRRDAARKKEYGLVIDVKAKSTIAICNRVQYYLKLNTVFPWKYHLETVDGKYFVNTLTMIEGETRTREDDLEFMNTFAKKYTSDEITKYFVREIPDDPRYCERLEKELSLIVEKNLFGNMVRALEILELTKNIPHVTRGSCGSSLVCYLLGISHMDPIQYDICFARFINQYRDTLPDIDFDFPHYLRDEVFLKLFQKWGDKVARISNHNYFHEKSALRESLRRNGVRKFISKYELNSEIDAMDETLKKSIYNTQKELDGQFRGYSLHCGGIIYFPEGVPEEYVLDKANKSVIQQVHLNKVDVAEKKSFKIDILSSRALSQLYYCHKFTEIDFNAHIGDEKTISLLSEGDNIGITLAETPLMRKALLLIQPKTIMDLAVCLAIIRPAAKDAKKEFELGKYRKEGMIFDDDAIRLIAKMLKCDDEKADKLRRGYCKGDKKALDLLDKYIGMRPKVTQTKIKNMLSNLRKYGFCRAHALSYAQLVWQLAYQKAHHPDKFWESTLKNIDTCYRKWVHIYEAALEGISYSVKEEQQSIYARQRGKKMNVFETEAEISQLECMRKFGVWKWDTEVNFYPNCYCFKANKEHIFCGLIASSRMISYGKKRTLIVCLGVDAKKYIELSISGKFYFDSRKVIVKGKGIMKLGIYKTIECMGKDIEFT